MEQLNTVRPVSLVDLHRAYAFEYGESALTLIIRVIDFAEVQVGTGSSRSLIAKIAVQQSILS